jgi:hypothetical protein
MPLYFNPALCPPGSVEYICKWDDPNAGLITNRDDHVWLGDGKTLTGGNWWEIFADPLSSLGKHSVSNMSITSSGADE